MAKCLTRVFYNHLRKIDIQRTTDQQGASAVRFCFISKIMRIKAFPFQRHEQASRRHFPCVGNDRIEREIRPAVFGAKDIGNFAERYANHAITPSKRAAVTRSE
ncbi:Uncharacterised protein [Salmonella enterica subsp. enterica serovar Typhi]|nr:Uncharacterised protein [Salmonella enterica subsp. enterica serovar Typhi]CRJ09077.1 Uncharacterised protein [Salmonella enterica subsp. enterica serovar Typhi]CRJ43707.1 Uncharacterised protein [Salmonella enterica subsp. enterica serovar Typhi]